MALSAEQKFRVAVGGLGFNFSTFLFCLRVRVPSGSGTLIAPDALAILTPSESSLAYLKVGILKVGIPKVGSPKVSSLKIGSLKVGSR